MSSSISAPPFSGEPEFSKEATPTFGAAGDWGNEKTILVMDPTEQLHAAWLQNKDTGEWHSLDDFPVTIGRHEECGLRINDGSLSRRHASIVKLDDGAFVIEDCGSTNGIKVNDCKVDRVILAAGDEVLLGNAGFTFNLHGPDGVDTSVLPAKDDADSFEALKAGVANLWQRGMANLKPSQSDGAKDERKTEEDEASPSGATRWVKDHPGTSVFVAALLILLPAGFFYNTVVLDRVMSVPVPVAEKGGGSASETPLGEPPGDVIVAAFTDSARALVDATASALSPSAELPLPVGPVVDLGEVEVRAAAPAPAQPAEVTPSVAAAPPRPPKVVPAEQSEKRIANSLAIYSGGNAPDALMQLIEMSNSKTHGSEYREQAHELHQRVAAAYSDYEAGKTALEGGDKNVAFAAWLEFLTKEAALLDGQKSAYARAVNDEVVREYTNQGNQAEAEERFQDAHRLWRQAAQLQPAGAAAASIDRLQEKAKQHYLEGYRLESANINKAREHWLKTVDLAAPGTEYSTKAKAKLRWYGVATAATGSEQ